MSGLKLIKKGEGRGRVNTDEAQSPSVNGAGNYQNMMWDLSDEALSEEEEEYSDSDTSIGWEVNNGDVVDEEMMRDLRIIRNSRSRSAEEVKRATAAVAAKISSARRRIGMPPVSPSYFSTARSSIDEPPRRDLTEEEQIQLKRDREDLLRAVARRALVISGAVDANSRDDSPSMWTEWDIMTTTQLRERAQKELKKIRETKISRHIRGTRHKALIDSANAVEEAVFHLSARTITDEAVRLRTDNDQLKREVQQLRHEIEVLKETNVKSPGEKKITVLECSATTPQPILIKDAVEKLKSSLTTSIGEIISIRLAAIEKRLPPGLLRPPLATDKRWEENESQITGRSTHFGTEIQPGSSRTVTSNGSAAEPSSVVVRKNKKKRKRRKRRGAKNTASPAAKKSRDDFDRK